MANNSNTSSVQSLFSDVIDFLTSARPKAGKEKNGKKKKNNKRKVDKFAKDPNSTAGKLKKDREEKRKRLEQINREIGR